MLCKYKKDANWSTGQLFLQIDAVDNYWKLWQLVVLRVFVDPFFTIIAIFGCGNLFWANLTNFGFGWFVWKINKLLLRTPFLHIVQMFGFGHLFFETFADIPSGHIFANCRSGQLFVCPSPLSNIFYSFSFSPPLTKYFTSSNGLPLADDQCVHWITHSLSPPPPPYSVSVLFSSANKMLFFFSFFSIRVQFD